MKTLWLGVLLIALAGVGIAAQNSLSGIGLPSDDQIQSFEECVAAGNPVMESYPEQCRTEIGETFTRDIGNELEKIDLIRIESPRPGGAIVSPLSLKGTARGYWFFEATAPVELRDEHGGLRAQGYIEAIGPWMTEEFVSFEGRLDFVKPNTLMNGELVLRRANPSGLPEHNDTLRVPIHFK